MRGVWGPYCGFGAKRAALCVDAAITGREGDGDYGGQTASADAAKVVP